MADLIDNNIVLILAVVGAILALAASLYENIAKQKKLRIIVTFLSAGAIITVGTLILNDLHEKNREQIASDLEDKKQEMISSISKNVSDNLNISQQTLSLLEQIESKFRGVPLEEVAVELSSPDLEGLHVFDKAHPSQIPRFVEWLKDKVDQGQTTAIGLTINADRQYIVGLILAYILANESNLGLIMQKLQSPEDWSNFPDQETLQAIGKIQTSLKYVLFYDGNESRLLGYADANLFARELLVYQSQKRTAEIETLLMVPGEASISSLETYFSSYSHRVLAGGETFDVARELIDMRYNDGVFLHRGRPWFISLAKVIKLAT